MVAIRKRTGRPLSSKAPEACSLRHLAPWLLYVFLGGSLIKHGGQNPLEAVRFGCNILYGPNVHNFREIYQFLDKEKISYKTRSVNEIFLRIKKLMEKKTKKNLKRRIDNIGKEILTKCLKELNQYL